MYLNVLLVTSETPSTNQIVLPITQTPGTKLYKTKPTQGPSNPTKHRPKLIACATGPAYLACRQMACVQTQR